MLHNPGQLVKPGQAAQEWETGTKWLYFGLLNQKYCCVVISLLWWPEKWGQPGCTGVKDRKAFLAPLTVLDSSPSWALEMEYMLEEALVKQKGTAWTKLILSGHLPAPPQAPLPLLLLEFLRITVSVKIH